MSTPVAAATVTDGWEPLPVRGQRLQHARRRCGLAGGGVEVAPSTESRGRDDARQAEAGKTRGAEEASTTTRSGGGAARKYAGRRRKRRGSTRGRGRRREHARAAEAAQKRAARAAQAGGHTERSRRPDTAAEVLAVTTTRWSGPRRPCCARRDR
jgi:hypothetical protein